MRIWTGYECWLNEQRSFFYYEESEDNEYPYWLRFEFDAYYWMFRLRKRIVFALSEGGTLSAGLQEQMKNAAGSRRLRYRSISPELRQAVTGFAADMSRLYEELRREPQFWRNQYTLTKKGRKFTEEAVNRMYGYLQLEPNPAWRFQRERELAYPQLCRYDAFAIAASAAEEHYNIRVSGYWDRTSPGYTMSSRCKNGSLTAELKKCGPGIWDEICTVQVDLTSGEYTLIPAED